jgi:hypothetical protein
MKLESDLREAFTAEVDALFTALRRKSCGR